MITNFAGWIALFHRIILKTNRSELIEQSCLGGTASQKLFTWRKIIPPTWELIYVEVRSQLSGMNQFSYKRFVFTKRNIPFCRELTQMRRLIWVGWFFSYKQLLSSIQTYFTFLKNTKLATCIKSLQSVFSKKYFFYVTLVVPQMNLWSFFFSWWGESLISFLAKILAKIIDICSSSLAKPLKLITFFHAFQHLIS